jgi:CheY-like chemotaxis protein
MRSLRVLVAEDEPVLQMMLEDVLIQLDCTVVATCSSRWEAIELSRTEDLDFAVIDYWLGSEKSDDVIAILKQRGIPVILATGMANHLGPCRDEVSGVVDKPYSTTAIKAAIDQCVRSRKPDGLEALSPPLSNHPGV